MNKILQELKVSLLNTDHLFLDHNWDYDNVISPFSRMYFIKSGAAKVYHSNKVFDLNPGYCYLIPSYTYSRYKCDNAFEQYYIHFLEEVGKGLSIYNLQNFIYESPAKGITEALFRRLLEINPHRKLIKRDPKDYDSQSTVTQYEQLNESLSPAKFVETQGIITALLSLFINPGAGTRNTKPGKITDTLYYISEHLNQPLTIEQLAERCHLHPDYFSRLFKEHTRSRPLQYIQNKRIERAQLLLTTTNHSLQQIADMIGLPNISYFNRLFLRYIKKTPGAYRKENLGI